MAVDQEAISLLTEDEPFETAGNSSSVGSTTETSETRFRGARDSPSADEDVADRPAEERPDGETGHRCVSRHVGRHMLGVA
ncbi:MAG: hypothetical protein Q8P67_20350, partial [archaeon]|nr:hypothetical protein [archaeon]